MFDLEKAINNSLKGLLTGPTVTQMIDEKVEKLVSRALDDILCSYSDFGKAVKTEIESKFNLDFKNLDLPMYNDLVLKIIKKQLDGQINERMKEAISENMEFLFRPTPEEMRLSELVDSYVEYNVDDYHPDYYDSINSVITVIHEESDDSDGYGWVYLNPVSGADKHSCEIRMAYDRDGRIYSLKLGREDAKQALFVGPFYDFERKLFQMHVNKTKLIIDEVY